MHSRTKTVIAFFNYDSILSYSFEDGNVLTLKATVKHEDDNIESMENEETYHFVTEQVRCRYTAPFILFIAY